MPQQPGQYDGFNYLGLGVLALITAALLFSLRRAVRCPQNTKTWWHRNGPVFAACVFLTLFAVSNKIYWGNTGIELPLPAKLLELCGIFRSSGRMFYLVAACMVVYALYTLWDRLPGRYAVLVLALFVGVQAFDLSAAAQQKRQKFADPINATVVNNDQTASLGAGHTQLLAARGSAGGPPALLPFWRASRAGNQSGYCCVRQPPSGGSQPRRYRCPACRRAV